MSKRPKDRKPDGKFTKASAARFGSIGGRNRRRNLTAAERSAIARRAGLARHGLTDESATE